MLTASKKGVPAHQIHRSLDIDCKSAWFMMHRLREALRQDGHAPMGGAGETVDIDETFQGFQERANWKTKRRATQFHRVVLTLVQRGGWRFCGAGRVHD